MAKAELEMLKGALDKYSPTLEKLIPKNSGLDLERFKKIALMAASKNPTLAESDIASLITAIYQSAELGLEPNTFGHVWLLPYYNRNAGKKLVQFQIGYQGFIELIYRTGEVDDVEAHMVYSGDVFDITYGSQRSLTHKPATKQEDRGERIGVYAVAYMTNGMCKFEYLNMHEINEVRNASKSKDNGPWQSWFDEMAKKTAVKRLTKYMKKTPELKKALMYDETTKVNVVPDMEGEKDVTDWDENVVDLTETKNGGEVKFNVNNRLSRA